MFLFFNHIFFFLTILHALKFDPKVSLFFLISILIHYAFLEVLNSINWFFIFIFNNFYCFKILLSIFRIKLYDNSKNILIPVIQKWITLILFNFRFLFCNKKYFFLIYENLASNFFLIIILNQIYIK